MFDCDGLVTAEIINEHTQTKSSIIIAAYSCQGVSHNCYQCSVLNGKGGMNTHNMHMSSDTLSLQLSNTYS